MDTPAIRTDPETTTPEGPSRRWSRVPRLGGVWRFVRVVLLIYLGLVVVLYALQTHLIFPGRATQGRPEAQVRPGPGTELVHLTTADDQRVVALFGPALSDDGTPHPDAASQPTLLYFYGNGMCLAYATDEFDRFRRLGANVLIPDYLGYGMSGGTPSEAGCYATADTAYEHLRRRDDVDSERIMTGGWSLGAAVAADLASRRPVAGLFLFSPFTSAVDMGRRSFPFLPVDLLLRHRFDTRTKLANVTCPILIGHGRRDAIIPYSMSDQLEEAAGGPVMRLVIDEADHNDFYLVGGTQIDEALGRFLSALP